MTWLRIETCWSVFKCFNIDVFVLIYCCISKWISWYVRFCDLRLNKSDRLPKTGECTTFGTFCLNYWIVGLTFCASLYTARNSWVGLETLTIKAIFRCRPSVTAWSLQLHWASSRDSDFLRSSVGGQLSYDALVLRGTAPL